jgi:hypothetical protein
MNKIQNSKQNRFCHLELKVGIYLGFGICHFELITANPVWFPFCWVKY